MQLACRQRRRLRPVGMRSGSGSCSGPGGFRGVVFDEPGQALVQLVDLAGELLDALGEHAQRHAGGLGHRVLVSPTIGWAEARAGAEQLGVAEARQPFPQHGVGDDQNGLELVDRLGAGLDRGVLGELVDPGAVHGAVAGFRPCPGVTTEHGQRGSLCIERVRLAEQTAGRPVGPVHLEHLDVLSQQVPGQTRAEGAGALHTGPAHRPPFVGPRRATVGGRPLWPERTPFPKSSRAGRSRRRRAPRRVCPRPGPLRTALHNRPIDPGPGPHRSRGALLGRRRHQAPDRRRHHRRHHSSAPGDHRRGMDLAEPPDALVHPQRNPRGPQPGAEDPRRHPQRPPPHPPHAHDGHTTVAVGTYLRPGGTSVHLHGEDHLRQIADTFDSPGQALLAFLVPALRDRGAHQGTRQRAT